MLLRKEDIDLLQSVNCSSPAHYCRLHHDVDFASGKEVQGLVQLGVEVIWELDPVSQEKIGAIRPLCSEIREKNPTIIISIGCAHSGEIRSAMHRVLNVISINGYHQTRCRYLINSIISLNTKIQTEDKAMNQAREDHDDQQKKEVWR